MDMLTELDLYEDISLDEVPKGAQILPTKMDFRPSLTQGFFCVVGRHDHYNFFTVYHREYLVSTANIRKAGIPPGKSFWD